MTCYDFQYNFVSYFWYLYLAMMARLPSDLVIHQQFLFYRKLKVFCFSPYTSVFFSLFECMWVCLYFCYLKRDNFQYTIKVKTTWNCYICVTVLKFLKHKKAYSSSIEVMQFQVNHSTNWGCFRAIILICGRYLQLSTLSHTNTFSLFLCLTAFQLQVTAYTSSDL